MSRFTVTVTDHAEAARTPADAPSAVNSSGAPALNSVGAPALNSMRAPALNSSAAPAAREA
ncbi:MAG: hypothetical protein U0R70_12765 [Solirubrobacteraceae bacterium]